jgi:hypothetical protein
MNRDGVPLTRENVIARAYMMGDPEEWTAELEASLPPMFKARGPFDDDTG